jgi:predicted O-linked N-acetylglucosamine transferase (SPINDLY family)
MAKIPVRFQRAQALHQRGRLADAQRIYEEILKKQSEHFGALHFLGVIAAQTEQAERAMELMAKSLLLNDKNAVAYNNYGNALVKVHRCQAAIENYDRAIALKRDYADAYFNRGVAFFDIEDYRAAIASYDKAIALNRNNPDAYFNRALTFSRLNDYTAALASYDLAIANRANYAEAYSNRGFVLKELNQFEAALASYDQAIAVKPDFAEAHSNRALVLKELGKTNAALASYNQAIAIKPDFADAYNNLANAFQHLGQHEAATASYDRTIALKPDFPSAFGMRQYARMQVCEWDHFAAELVQLAATIERGEAAENPFCLLALTGSPLLQKKAAEIWVRQKCPPAGRLRSMEDYARHDKIRIGYFSSDFRDHPVSHLTVEPFETHDRSRFETSAFSFGPDTRDEVRKRMEKAFDRFIDVRRKFDHEVALLARSMEIDIAVDLGGFIQGCRPRIFAMRAAPLQVSYIGYLGTMGAEYMDYLIADATIIPAAEQRHYSEKILYLPSYQANDSKRVVADKVFSREELGLPQTGFVFCCFNTSYKIAPGTFDGWMRILTRVEGSVLFMYSDAEAIENNLRKEARRRGVDAARLVFGKRLPRPEYLARYRAADLFLDTLPYNAGTTASDALWVGLPVLTCLGEAFAGRVAASLLKAIQLPELIASGEAEYEELAVELATNAQRLAEIKQRLATNRLTTPLFDTPMSTKQLEAAYTKIYERYHADLPAEHTYVTGE